MSETSRGNESKKRKASWKDSLAGGAAGAFSRSVMAPVERVKLLMQLRDRNLPSRTAWQTAKEVYVEQGFLSFWRGNFPNVCRVAGTAAINFSALQIYKPLVAQRLPKSWDRQHIWTGFLSGGLAGATSTTLLYPMEFVRTRLAMDKGRNTAERLYKGTWDVIQKIGRTDGIAGFFQGYGIALAGGVFYRVMYLGGYDALKSEFVIREYELSWGERLVLAQSVSLTAGTLAYPFDSVRRRMMMQAGMLKSERRYRNSFHCFRTVLSQEGIRGFFLGIGPNLLRSIGGALLLVGYDRVRSIL
jgi:solute carrier family 25 (adenine nucleotide translocator) protein 4/5/6/31